MHHKTADAPKTAGSVIHWARFYDLFGKLISFGRDSAIRERLVRLAAPAPGEKVLDVGCGTGTLAIAIKPRVGEGEDPDASANSGDPAVVADQSDDEEDKGRNQREACVDGRAHPTRIHDPNSSAGSPPGAPRWRQAEGGPRFTGGL